MLWVFISHKDTNGHIQCFISIMALVRVSRPEIEKPNKKSRNVKYVNNKKKEKKKLLQTKWRDNKRKYRAIKKEEKVSAIKQLANPSIVTSTLKNLFMSHPHSVATIMNCLRMKGSAEEGTQGARTTKTEILRVYGYPTVFKTPAQIIIAGPTKTGKSTLVTRILEHKDTMFDTPFEEITYYAANANAFEGMKDRLPFVTFREGQPDWARFRSPSSQKGSRLVILDDMQDVISGKFKSDIEQLFAVHSHHNKISVIFIVHDNYKKNMLTLRRNADYLLYMTGGSALTQVRNTVHQVFNDTHACNEAAKVAIEDIKSRSKFGYLLLTTNNTVDSWRAISTNIFPGQQNTFYIPPDTLEVPSLVRAKEIARRQSKNGISEQQQQKEMPEEEEKMEVSEPIDANPAPTGRRGRSMESRLPGTATKTPHASSRKKKAKK